MNIFYLDESPIEAAKMHLDKHVVKMILESCQLLSTAHRVLDGREEVVKRISDSGKSRNVKKWILPDERDSILYSATHNNHPSAIWCRENDKNYNWLVQLTEALCDEYTYRYGKVHKCKRIGLVEALNSLPLNITRAERITKMPQAMPEAYRGEDSVLAYRKYYMMDKRRFAKWRKRETPIWFK